jgi:hypothetical protein
VSKDAVTLAGTVAFTGSSYHAEALLGRHEEFINVLGSWYGDRTKGLADAQVSEGVATFCRLTEITYVAGADDHLPRELRITADFDKATLATLADSSDDDSVKELDRLKLELDVKLTQWGKDVTYTAPAHPKSIDDLGKAVIGLFFQAAA